jgi:P-type Cu+ transporter
LLVGSRRFVLPNGGYLPGKLEDFEATEAELGHTVIFASLLSSRGEPLPVLAVSLADSPKPSSVHAIKALKEMGIEVCMMTGDGRTTALAVAKQVGIKPEAVWASMSPKGKATTVAEIMQKGDGGVAMVRF